MKTRKCAIALVAVMALVGERAQAQDTPPSSGGGETVREAMCRLIETAARKQELPIGFFTRLIYRESSFRPHVVSSAGAQGVAQFMPGTAAERGLADPFDPEQAIPASAHLLADLRARFGNLGLAAAAYNGGPNRVANFKERGGFLPAETREYVASITGASVEEWVAGKTDADLAHESGTACLTIVARLMRPGQGQAAFVASAPFAPWGVQLAGNFSRALALSAYRRAETRLAAIIGERQPMIIGTRLRSRGTRAFYRVRVPAPSRQAADQLCASIRGKGGACIVLKS